MSDMCVVILVHNKDTDLDQNTCGNGYIQYKNNESSGDKCASKYHKRYNTVVTVVGCRELQVILFYLFIYTVS